jgi:hypothetical protein
VFVKEDKMNWVYSIGVVILGLSTSICFLAYLQYFYVHGPKWLVREGSEPSIFLMLSGLLVVVAIVGLTLGGILGIVHSK